MCHLGFCVRNINMHKYLVLKILIEKSGGRKQKPKAKYNKPLGYAERNDRTGEEKKNGLWGKWEVLGD